MSLLSPLPRRVLVFVPYMEENGRLVSSEYDIPEYRSELGGWMTELGVEWEWVPITTRSLASEVQRASVLAQNGEAVVLNLCDGTGLDAFPGVEVINRLVENAVPFTGACAEFYRLSTSKSASKSRFAGADVSTSPWVVVRNMEDVEGAADLRFPLFVKPDVSAGSVGIQVQSVVHDLDTARRRTQLIRAGLHGENFGNVPVLIEQFIEGREFTVLVVEDPREPLGLFVLPPGERVFDPRVPPGERFLAYERYWDLPEADRPLPAGEPFYWYELAPPDVRQEVASIARRAFRAVSGEGYARVDVRLETATDTLMVLEVNAQCGLSSDDSSTVGSLLRLSQTRMSAVVERILRHGMSRSLEKSHGVSSGSYAYAMSADP